MPPTCGSISRLRVLPVGAALPARAQDADDLAEPPSMPIVGLAGVPMRLSHAHGAGTDDDRERGIGTRLAGCRDGLRGYATAPGTSPGSGPRFTVILPFPPEVVQGTG